MGVVTQKIKNKNKNKNIQKTPSRKNIPPKKTLKSNTLFCISHTSIIFFVLLALGAAVCLSQSRLLFKQLYL